MQQRSVVAALLRIAPSLAALSACAVIAGCSTTENPDDGAVCSAYGAARSHVEVVAAGDVARVLGVDPGREGAHEGFLLRLNGGCRLTVRVETNTSFTGEFPLQRGDRVVVKGEYEYYERGGVIHWTHRDPRGHHANGYVEVHGTMYY
jgi:hypothetical protein